MHTWTWALILSVAAMPVFAQRATTTTGPVELRVDNLKNPLGIDDTTPNFSWQLRDAERGAKQTAYEVLVASSPELLAQGKADVWNSGRVASGQSLNVRYGGPALKPSTHYSWCVKLWGANGKAYAANETGWFETGLVSQDAWKAQWIGWETPEEATVRHAQALWIANPDAKSPAIAKDSEQRFAYRTTITLPHSVTFCCALRHRAGHGCCVGEWGAGAQQRIRFRRTSRCRGRSSCAPRWQRKLGAGTNTIAIEVLHYVVNPNGMATDDAPPMIATLVVEYADGTWASFQSNTEWKTAISSGRARRRLAAEGFRRRGVEGGHRVAAAEPAAIGVAGTSVDSGFGEGVAARFHDQRSGQVGAAVCNGARRVRDVPERQARGRPGAGAGMDGLSRAGDVPDLRRDGPARARERTQSAHCSRRDGTRRRWSGSSSRTIMA